MGSLLSAGGLFLLSLRTQAPVWVTDVLANALLLPSWMIFDFGIIKAARLKPPVKVGWPFCAIGLASMTWFGIVTPNHLAQVLTQNLLFVSFDLYAAYACLTVPESRIAFTFKLIAGLLVLSVIACIWRMAGGVFGLTLGFSPTLPWLLWIATSIVIFSMVTMLLALNASQRLQDEINHQAHHDALTGAYNSVGSLLAKLKLTPQKPLQSVYQRDPEAIERWQRDTFPAMAKQSKAEGAEIPFFGTNRVFVPMPSMARRGLSVVRPR